MLGQNPPSISLQKILALVFLKCRIINMNDYIEKFQSAHFRSTLLYGEQMNPSLNIDLEQQPYDLSIINAIVVDFKDGVVNDSSGLPGNCFGLAREASYVLFELGVDNAVTIGNVLVDNEPHFTTTEETLALEVKEGFLPDIPANAHAWLTLSSGQILDVSILASYAHQSGKELPLLSESIFLSGCIDVPTVHHLPFITGLAYHFKVVTHPNVTDGSYNRYYDWLKDSYIFKKNIETKAAKKANAHGKI
jgi:hypothetical protein